MSVSIKDVAEMAGVSISTVSRYVNSPDQVRAPTAKRVEEAIKKTGYEANWFARNFRTGKTQQIMVVIPSIGIPFYGPILEGVRKVAQSAGYHILVIETAFHTVKFDDFTKMIMSKQADGILLLSTLSPFTEPNINTNAVHPPIVLGLENIAYELAHFPCVCIDNEAATREGTQYLIQLGHKKIGFLHGYLRSLGHQDSELTKSRIAGFRAVMAANKLDIEEDWVIKAPLSINGGRQAVRDLLAQKTRPTAIFCSNDEMALGAMHELKKSGLKIPEDISIIGIDNMVYSEIADPPLTTIEQPAYDIGEKSMSKLLKIISGESDTGVEIIPHRLIVRQSCKPVDG